MRRNVYQNSSTSKHARGNGHMGFWEDKYSDYIVIRHNIVEYADPFRTIGFRILSTEST